MSLKSRLFIISVSVMLMSACASTQMKARKEQREKAAQSSRIWCEFVNGEIFPDVDVATNLEMAKRCDPDKNFSITSYRTPSENQGVIYCCSVRGDAAAATSSGASSKGKDSGAPAEAPAGN